MHRVKHRVNSLVPKDKNPARLRPSSLRTRNAVVKRPSCPIREFFALTMTWLDEEPWDLLPLGEMPGQMYPAPGTLGSVKPTKCSCSRVAYNLFSACAACQIQITSGTPWVGYSVWNQSCEAEVIDRQVHLRAWHTKWHKRADKRSHLKFRFRLLRCYCFSSVDEYFRSGLFLGECNHRRGGGSHSASSLTSTSTNIMPSNLPPPLPQTQDGQLDGLKPDELSPSPPSVPVDTSANVAETASVSTAGNNANPNLLPQILAPILSVVVVGALVGVWYYFYRQKRAKRVAPSAEFTKYQRAPIPLGDVEGGAAAAGVRGMRSIDNRPASYALQDNGEEAADGEAPPAFTPGLFKDPIFEKGVAMSLANQSGTWPPARRGHTSDTTTTAGSGGGGVGGMGSGDVRTGTERQDSLGLVGGDSPASLSMLAHGSGQLQLERQRLIPPPEDRE